MGRIALLVLVAVLLLAAALVWQAPATLATTEVARASAGAVVLANAEGTVWNGHGTVVAGPMHLPVRWQTDARALLRREVAVNLLPQDVAAAAPRAHVVAGRDAVRIRDLRVELPAQVLVDALITRPRLAASGTVDVSSPAFVWPLPAASVASLVATWHGASLGLAGSPPVGLGEVTANLRAENGRLAGPLRNVGGEFAIDGELQVFGSGAGLVRGIVRPRTAGDPRIDALKPLGTVEGNGVRLEWKWPAP